jgi:hypothetical protein
VIRAGYGMYAAPLTIDSFSQSGFDFTTSLVPTANNGLTFLATTPGVDLGLEGHLPPGLAQSRAVGRIPDGGEGGKFVAPGWF